MKHSSSIYLWKRRILTCNVKHKNSVTYKTEEKDNCVLKIFTSRKGTKLKSCLHAFEVDYLEFLLRILLLNLFNKKYIFPHPYMVLFSFNSFTFSKWIYIKRSLILGEVIAMATKSIKMFLSKYCLIKNKL